MEKLTNVSIIDPHNGPSTTNLLVDPSNKTGQLLVERTPVSACHRNSYGPQHPPIQLPIPHSDWLIRPSFDYSPSDYEEIACPHPPTLSDELDTAPDCFHRISINEYLSNHSRPSPLRPRLGKQHELYPNESLEVRLTNATNHELMSCAESIFDIAQSSAEAGRSKPVTLCSRDSRPYASISFNWVIPALDRVQHVKLPGDQITRRI